MNSYTFTKVLEIVGSQAALARLLNVSQPTVNQWATGLRPIPPQRAVAIEQATEGAVTRRDLRPDDWHLIWPELAEQPAEAVGGAT